MSRSRPQADLAAIAGLLLAGGESRRFGAEKAVAVFRGAPMMDAVAQVFSMLTAYAISARPNSCAERRAQQLGVPVVYDEAGVPRGPLAGLAAGLSWAARNGFDYLATAPCDAPLLPADLVPRLAERIAGKAAAFAVTAHGDHPLCAIWRVELLHPLRERLTQSHHPAVRAFLEENRAEAVRFDNPVSFANANRPDVLHELDRCA